MDYSTLQLSIADYLHRSDLTAVIPTFISVAEASLFREISAPETELAVTGVTVGGYAVLPTDYGALSKLSVTYGGSSRLLDYISIAEVTTSVEANPGYYSFEAGKLRIYGTGDGQAYTLYYLPTLTPLSTSVTTNWLLTNAPDLYLYASCLEGAKHQSGEWQSAKDSLSRGVCKSNRGIENECRSSDIHQPARFKPASIR